MRNLFAAFSLLLAASCGSPTPGGACASSGECPEGFTCNTALPGGACTRSCTQPGTVDVCGGGVCTNLSSGSYCLARCADKIDCRASYNCNGISGSNLKSCQP